MSGHNSGDLVGGNGDMLMMREQVEGVKHVDFLKEILQVVEWINNGNEQEGATKEVDGTSSPLASKLEERFKTANARISELEGQLGEAREENGELKEKLNAMELLAGHHQCELIRLNRELQIEKWERFDVEARLKKMVKEVAILHATIGELVSKLQDDESSNCPPIVGGPAIKKEIPDEEELLEGGNKLEEFRCMFVELSSTVQQKLQKCEGMQRETKVELAGIITGLSNLEQMISGGKNGKRKLSLSTVAAKSSDSTNIPSPCHRVKVPPPPPVVEPPKLTTVPIKSILMKRSADGTFVIRRDSQDQQQQQQQPIVAAKRKRVQFCLDDPNSTRVHNDHKENHRQTSHESSQELTDPPEVDNSTFPPSNEEDHFEITGTQKDTFYCNCGRSFLRKKLLNRHLSTKLNGKIFNCPICTKTFVLHESLKRHVKKSHKIQYHGGTFGCRECGQTFTIYRQLRQHRTTHQRRKQIAS